ncbi:hypothetical protein QL285_003140 [Trifolium repens]|nr:hypothetical protein QL285_003140 [Trifolium repens]
MHISSDASLIPFYTSQIQYQENKINDQYQSFQIPSSFVSLILQYMTHYFQLSIDHQHRDIVLLLPCFDLFSHKHHVLQHTC